MINSTTLMKFDFLKCTHVNETLMLQHIITFDISVTKMRRGLIGSLCLLPQRVVSRFPFNIFLFKPLHCLEEEEGNILPIQHQ